MPTEARYFAGLYREAYPIIRENAPSRREERRKVHTPEHEEPFATVDIPVVNKTTMSVNKPVDN